MGCGQSHEQPPPAKQNSAPTRLPESLENVLEQSPYAMCASDIRYPDQPMVYVNDRLLDAFGYKRSDMLNYNCRFLQGPETDASTVRHIRESIAEGKTFMGRLMNYTKGGEQLWNYLLLQPLRNAAGEVTHYTSLSIMAAKDDYNTAMAAAKELSMLVDHIEDQGVDMAKPENSLYEKTSFKQPQAPSRASFDTAHRLEGRRASVLMQDLRGHLDRTLCENEVLLAILGSKKDCPVMYASQHLLGETFLRETELLGANLTFLLGKPTTAEEEGMFNEIITNICRGLTFTQERWLRTRHKVMQSLWGTLHFTPIEIGGEINYYMMVFNKSREDRAGNLQADIDCEDMMKEILQLTRMMLMQSLDGLSGSMPVSRVSMELPAGEYIQHRGHRGSIPLPAIADDEDVGMASQRQSRDEAMMRQSCDQSLLGRPSQEEAAKRREVSQKEEEDTAPVAPPSAFANRKDLLTINTASFSEMCTVLDDEDEDETPPHPVATLPPVDEEQRDATRGQNARRRLSINRHRRGASHTTLLPEKTQWIDLVLETMTKPDAPRWAVNESTLKALRDNLRANGPDIFKDMVEADEQS